MIMARNIQLNSTDWCDIVFTGKNKSYGAYALRQSSSKRHILAFLVVLIFVGVVAGLPSLLNAVNPPKEYVQKHIQDIIIENQGLKLYKDNESKRFKKLAVNFAYYCLMHDWLQNGFRCGGLSTEELYDKFINDPDEANS